MVGSSRWTRPISSFPYDDHILTLSRTVEDAVRMAHRTLMLNDSEQAGQLREAATSLVLQLGPFEHLIGMFPSPDGPIINLELADGLEAFVDLPRLADFKSHTSESDVWLPVGGVDTEIA